MTDGSTTEQSEYQPTIQEVPVTSDPATTSFENQTIVNYPQSQFAPLSKTDRLGDRKTDNDVQDDFEPDRAAIKKRLWLIFGILLSLILLIQGMLNKDYFPVDIIGLIFGTSSNLISIFAYTLIIFMIKFARFFVMPFTMIEKNPQVNGTSGTMTVLGVFKFPMKVGSGSKMVKSFFAFLKEFFIWCFSGWLALMLIFILSPFGLVSSKGADFARSVADFYLCIYILISLIDVYIIGTQKKIEHLADKVEEKPVDIQSPDTVHNPDTVIYPASHEASMQKTNEKAFFDIFWKITKVASVIFTLAFIGLGISFVKDFFFDIKNSNKVINQPIITHTQPLNVPDFKEDSAILISDIDFYGDGIVNKRAWLEGIVEKQSGINGQTDVYILKNGLRSIEFETAQAPEYQTLTYYSKFIGQNVRVHGIIHKIITYTSPDGRTQNSYTALQPIGEFIVQ